jgi:hypothetical protein
MSVVNHFKIHIPKHVLKPCFLCPQMKQCYLGDYRNLQSSLGTPKCMRGIQNLRTNCRIPLPAESYWKTF